MSSSSSTKSLSATSGAIPHSFGSLHDADEHGLPLHRGRANRLQERPRLAIVDRPSPRTVAVACWAPGEYHYGYQVWTQAVARRSALCSLTGAAIADGDLVYVPKAMDPMPRNADMMISVVQVGG